VKEQTLVTTGEPKKSVDLVYFDAGGGHRSAAQALEIVLAEEQQCHSRLVNLQEVLAPIDVVRKVTGLDMQDLYNLILKNNWTLGSAAMLKLMHGVIRLLHAQQVKLLAEHWRETRPQLVVSLVPHFNRALFESLKKSLPEVPFVTILTDFADYPPHFWTERQDQFFICGSERAVAQARAVACDGEKVYRTSGMIVHPRFYRQVDIDRGSERQRLSLDPAMTTGLVMFGGQGSKVMLEIGRRLDSTPLEVQLIFICGRNPELVKRLESERRRHNRLVVGYTREVPYYMRLSDFFIGKPGPGSISEAILMDLPLIVDSTAFTLPQERYNAEWIREKQVGIVLRSFSKIREGVETLLEPGRLARFRLNAAAIENRALFECADILHHIWDRFCAGLPAVSGA
jgi:1,2-diacylglycerol 3-beta-galactosyltransferase